MPDITTLDPSLLADVDLFSDQTRQEWFALASGWATRAPFYVINHGIPQVVVGRYADVREVLMSPERFTSTPPAQASDRFDAFMGLPHIGAMNGEPHDRIRRILQNWFGAAGIARYDKAIDRHIEQLLDELEASNGEIDVVPAFSRELIPRIMLGTMFGLDEEQRSVFLKMNKELETVALSGGYPTDYVEAFNAARQVIDQLIAARGARPTDDFISGLIKGRAKGEPITDEEIVANVFAICAAAITTTSTTMAMTLYAWMRHREQFEILVSEPELLAPAVEESLRLHPAGLFVFPRFAMTDCELGGTPITAGLPVHACVAAANLDPSVYPDPLTFDIRRRPRQIMSFGVGAHYCAGGILARKILQIGLRAFMRRYPNAQLAHPNFTVSYHGQLGEVAPASIPLRLR
jgi:cytochrome P450